MQPKQVAIGGAILLGLLCLPLIFGDKGGTNDITLEKYDTIQLSHRYATVRDIIGRDGILTGMTYEEAANLKNVTGRLLGKMARQDFRVYGWKNSKGSARGNAPRIFIMFANGKVVGKKQVGLE